MKKLKLLTLALSIPLVVLLIWKTSSMPLQTLLHSSDESASGRLEFLITGKSSPFSLSVFDSDQFTNLAVMEQVVGTLVKYNGVANYEPYLSSGWEVIDQGKRWRFKIREGLTTENGVPINAFSFRKNLIFLLGIYSKNYSPPTFNHLKGWNAFLAGDREKIGISTENENVLIFDFDVVPSGVLEFLSMPYFGFYAEDDFKAEEWKDRKRIHSSGSYRVTDYSELKISLTLRQDFPIVDKSGIANVTVNQGSFENFIKKSQQNFLIAQREESNVANENFVQMHGTPTLLTSVVLSPYIPPFDNLTVRKAFKVLVQNRIKSIELTNSLSIKSAEFYPRGESTRDQQVDVSEAAKILRSHGAKNIEIFEQNLTHHSDAVFFEKVIESVFAEVGWTFKIVTPDMLGPGWAKVAFSNKVYPIRLARVDIGGRPENWVIDMMFCSELGISFPDPGGKICALVKAHDLGKFNKQSDYEHDFFEAVNEQSAVIPVFHSGTSWIASKTLNLSNLSPSMGVPRLDHLRINP